MTNMGNAAQCKRVFYSNSCTLAGAHSVISSPRALNWRDEAIFTTMHCPWYPNENAAKAAAATITIRQ